MLFGEGCKLLLRQYLEGLRITLKQSEKIVEGIGNAKFGTGGIQLLGGCVDDFHSGLSGRIGEKIITFAFYMI